MSIALQNQLVKTISEKIPKECQIQKSGLKEIIKYMFSQRNNFQNFEYLSSGTYALVLKAKNIKENRIVALKFLTSSNKEDKNGIESLEKEYDMLQKFSQTDYLVNVYACFYLMEEEVNEDEDGYQQIVQTQEKSYFVMEMELQNLKQLFDFFRKYQLPSQEIKEIIAIQLLEGLNNLHVKNIMHRDIKPENYLVCLSKKQAFTIKLGDLGFASAVTKSKSFYQSKKGTDAYFAPEVEKGQSRIQSDLYSLGIVLLELDNLDKLNENWVDSATKTEIYEGKTIASKYQINRTSNIYKIAKTCLKPQYLERTTAGDLLSELIQLHGKPLQFILTSMILEDQIPQQAQHILNGIKQSQKNMQTKFEEEAKLLLDNTDTKIKIKDNEQKFTKVEILSKLLKSLYEVKKYSNNFQILSFGSYGMVLATKKIQFNYKEIVLKIQRIDDEKQIQNEIRIMNQLKTPLVVQLYDSYVIEKATAPERYIVFELEKCSCSLEEYLERQAIDTELSDEEKLTIARQIIDSVNYIHWFNIIHRDIKADNFLVCLDGDFGLSAQLQNNLESIETLDMIGNKAYMAPEIITKNDNENKIYSKKSDSYSVGLLLSLLDNYLILNGKAPSKKIGNAGAKDVGTGISQCKNIETLWLDLFSNEIGLAGAKELGTGIALCKNITTLLIDLISNEIGGSGAKYLATGIAQCKNITNLMLDFTYNQIGDAGTKDLINGIAQCKYITTLVLVLCNNKIYDAGAKELGTGIAQCKNIISLKLDLRLNLIY